MHPLVDALVILALLGVSVSLPVAALPLAVWLAFTTPLLVRSDVASLRLPNAVTHPALAIAPVGGVVAVVAGAWPPSAAAVALGVVVATAAVGCLAASRGAVGMGDVKLATAVACGAQSAWPGGAAVALVGCGVAGLVTLVVSRRRRPAPPVVPYGPAVLAGFWLAAALAP